MANSWYAYLGANKSPIEAASYARMTVKSLCLFGVGLCAIYLHDQTSDPPIISDNMRGYIADALATLNPQPDYPLKHLVYLKGQ